MKTKLKFLPETHQYFLDGKELYSVTTIIHHFLPAPAVQSAMEFGTNVHSLITAELEGKLKEEDKEGENPIALEYLLQFKIFLKESHFKPKEIEKMIYDRSKMIAGRIDLTGELHDKKILIDVKTGSWYPSYDLQLAGYEYIENTNGIKYDETGCLILSDKSWKFKKTKNREKSREIFLSMMKIFFWEVQNGIREV